MCSPYWLPARSFNLFYSFTLAKNPALFPVTAFMSYLGYVWIMGF